MTTSGYKARTAFQALPLEATAGPQIPKGERINLAAGPLQSTGNPFDLAIQGNGFFVLASEDGQVFYTRQGHFQRDAHNRVVTTGGHALQQAGGGDLIIEGEQVEILADGVVLTDGRPVAQIALATLGPGTGAQLTPVSGSIFSAAESDIVEIPAAGIRQGMIERSNVSLGDEMLTLMNATRHAETGARLVQVYDELMGRAFTTLGQRG